MTTTQNNISIANFSRDKIMEIGHLSLSRRCGEAITLDFGEDDKGNRIKAVITVAQMNRGQAKLIIEAPKSIRIARNELLKGDR